MDHSDNQKHAPGGQPSCGNPGQHTQTGGTQAQPTPHELLGHGGRDQKGTNATTQHKVVARPNEVVHQGRRYHVATTYDYAGLHLDGKHTPRHSAVKIHNE